MKRTVIGLTSVLVVVAAVFAVLVLRPVPKVKAGRGCSNASLRGNYGLVMKGTYIAGFTEYYLPQTWDFSMLAHFDGEGNLSASSIWDAYWGEVYDPGSFSGGMYTVNNDCTVSMTFPGVESFDGYEVYLNGILSNRDGDQVKGTAYNAEPFTGSFRAKKVQEEW
jgi:hypothetical protein